MRIIRKDSSEPESVTDTQTFTGQVNLQRIHTWNETATGRMSLVAFDPGARTHWHSHSDGQALIITEGNGMVQILGSEPESIHAGDIVIADSDERHWHGAGPSEHMTHAAVSRGDVTWYGPSTDEKATTAERQ